MTALDLTAAVEAGARAIDALDWTQAEFGCIPDLDDIARAALTSALPHILEPLAAEFEAEADDKDREADENADMDDDWRAQRACGARDAYRSAAKRLRGALS